MIYNLYIFDRHCSCIYYTRWNNRVVAAAAAGSSSSSAENNNNNNSSSSGKQMGGLVGTVEMGFEEEAKLVYGVVFSLRNFMNKMAAKR